MIKRKCLGCNEIKDRENLIRITKNYKNGEIVINPNENIFGRSVYICKVENCINSIFKKDKISKVIKKNLTKEEKENIRTVLNTMVVVKH